MEAGAVVIDNVLKYRLTEEVARQAVEVAVRQGGEWHVSFSNPTAGPWKMIQLPEEYGSRIFRYGKEEDRPDLILLSSTHKTGLVLEAKDSLAKLLAPSQLEKSTEVFLKEMNRFEGVLPSGFLWLCGYVYPVIAKELPLVKELHSRHAALASASGDGRIAGFVDLRVSTDANGDLHVNAYFQDMSSSSRTVLLSALEATAVGVG